MVSIILFILTVVMQLNGYTAWAIVMFILGIIAIPSFNSEDEEDKKKPQEETREEKWHSIYLRGDGEDEV